MIRYDKYKDSGVDWLGDIPDNWEVKRIKDLIFKIGSGVTPLGGGEVYVDKGIPFVRSQNVYDDGLRLDNVSFITEEINNRMPNSQLKPNDILINITGASIGRSCIVPLTLKKANINQHIIYLRAKKNIVPYLSTYIKSSSIKGYIMLIQAGSSKEALNMGQTLNIPILAPSFSEQTTIASYLDLKTSAIDRKVALLEQKITHYQQLRKSLINETVCRGLDKNVKLKDSGIEWIGKIPEHWEVKRLKDLSKKMGSGATPLSNIPSYYENGILNWVNTGDLNDGLINDCQYKISQHAINDYPNLKTNKKGTLLIAMYGATICKIGLLNIEATTNQACCCINFNKDYLSKFVFYWFLANKNHIISLSVGGTQPNISQGIISKLLIVIPSLSEQTSIATYLDEKTQKIDSIISNIKFQIETLKELRKTLINDVVTGKIKVTA